MGSWRQKRKPIRHLKSGPEFSEDGPLIEALNAASFGPGRFAKSAYRLREGVNPVAGLSFVAILKNPLFGISDASPEKMSVVHNLLIMSGKLSGPSSL